MLWLWALDNAPDGDISDFDADEIAEIVSYLGDPEKFVGALKTAGFVDENGCLHDWDDYAGKLIERREVQKEQARIRQQNRRKNLRKKRIPVTHLPYLTPPYPTVPYLTRVS
jgi:hypothetical protein